MCKARITAPGTWALLVVLSLLKASLSWAVSPYADRSLEDVLQDLAKIYDLQLVFTTAVVTPAMKVATEPRATEPQAILDELLDAHGLHAVDGPGGTLMIVPGARPGTVAGRVIHLQDGRPLARVEILDRTSGERTFTDTGGRFRLGLEAGSHTLVIRHAGLVPQEVLLTLAAGKALELEVELTPVPTAVEEIDIDTSRWSFLGEGPSTLVLDHARLGSLPSLAADPYRSLALFPGTTGNDISSRFNVRGGLPSEVTVRIDGVEILEPFHLQDFGGAFSILDPVAIDSVELKRGGYRADYGERRGGVVELTTTTPSKRQTRLGLSFLSLELSRGDARKDGRGSYLASLRLGSLQPAFSVTEEPENPSFSDAFLKIEHRLGESRSLLGYVLHSRNALDFQVVEDEEEAEERRSFDTRYLNAYAWVDYQEILGGDRFVETRLAASRLRRDREGAESHESAAVGLNDRRRLDLVDLAHTWSWRGSDAVQMRAGLEARRLETDYDYADERLFDDPLAALRSGPGSGSTRFRDSLQGHQLGLWSSARLTLSRRLELELGLRWDDNRLTRERYLSPRLNLSRELEGGGVLRLAWGLFRQSQRPDELQVADGETRLFDAERAEHRIVGYERDFGGPASLVLRVEAYQYRIDDPHPRFENLFQPLTFLPEIQADRVRLAPTGGRSEGIELFLRGGTGRRFDGWLGLTAARVRDRIDGRDAPRSIDQPLSVQLGLNYRGVGRWDFHLAWRWHTGWPTTAISARLESSGSETRVVPVLGELFAERLPDYNRLDLRVSRPFRFFRGELDFYVEIQNLLNENNVAGFKVSFEDAPDGPVTVREVKNWAGILPLAGFRWRL